MNRASAAQSVYFSLCSYLVLGQLISLMATPAPESVIDGTPTDSADGLPLPVHLYETQQSDVSLRIIKELNPEYVSEQCESLDPLVCFPVSSTWSSKKSLKKAMDIYAGYVGFSAIFKGTGTIKCSCHSTKPSSRNYAHGSTRRGCKFKLQMATPHTKISGPKSKVKKNVGDFDKGIVSVKSFFHEHTGSCIPSQQQRLLSNSRGAKYTSTIPLATYYNLCALMDRDSSSRVSSSTIRAMLSSNFPNGKNVTRQNIFNMIVILKRLLPKFKQCDNYKDFESMFDNQSELISIEKSSINDDEASSAINSLWQDYVNSIQSESSGEEKNEDNLTSENFRLFLELLSSKAKGFTYKIAAGSDNIINGVVWMTATMRSNFERFGSYICLDSMKRELNKHLWPYFAITMVNDLNKVCVGCEALLLGERDEAYEFILQATSMMAPKRKLSEILIFSGDGFFNREKIAEWGLVNAKYIADYWHMFNGVLSDRFTPFYYNKISEFLRKMAFSNSERDYTEAYDTAMSLLRNLENRNHRVESELLNLHHERSTFASYLLCTIPGNRLYHGSSIAEANHSSVLSSINKDRGQYMKTPQEQIRDLLIRQKTHVNETNSIIFGNVNRRDNFMFKLAKDNQQVDDIIVSASKELHWNAFTRFYDELKKSDKYKEVVLDNGKISVFHCTKNFRSGRIFESRSSRCNCSTRLAFLGTCRHKLRLKREKLKKI